MKKLLLIDGNAMLFRAYYATAYGTRMQSSKGIPTNAVFGFATMMQKAIEIVEPDAILVAFDAGKHTFRHELYQDYKGGRKPAPDDLVPQFQLTRDYLDSFGIKWVEETDIEADDLIGTMAKQATDYSTTVLTSDRDLLQIIDDSTSVLLMKKGLTEMVKMTPDVLKEEMGIEPLQIIDLKGLMGDSSDNIPGIPGVGEKTALKLLNEYQNIENVIEHVDELKGSLKTKVENGKDLALLSKTLATIKRDVNLTFGVEDCAFKPNYETLINFFNHLDMKSLVSKYEPYLDGEVVPTNNDEVDYEVVNKVPQDLLTDMIAIYVDANNETFMHADMYGLALTDGKKIVYISLDDAKKDKDLVLYLKDKAKKKIGFDVKRNLHILNRSGIDVSFSDDTMILATLVDSTLTNIEKIFARFNLFTTNTIEQVYGKPSKPILADSEVQTKHACEYVSNIYKLYNLTSPLIDEYGMRSLYEDIEMPLTYILQEMEEIGIDCDKQVLSDIAKDLQDQIDGLQSEIFKYSKREFNINSPKQLAEILFDELELPTDKKRSTAAEVLEKLVDEHPIISCILEYRKLQKIVSTYAEGLQKYIDVDGRIHTLYNQCATQTGRLSSSEPNLQNISVRDEQGKVIRKAFLPSSGNVLLASDYHQIELRILADLANEENLIEAFKEGIDIHTKTAMDVFGVEQKDVDSSMRRSAKTVNFGIVYGISDFGLAQQLHITRKEANEFINQYYASYPNIKTYMDKVIAECERDGYVTTICGRRREIPEIHDKNRMIKEFGKRAAMNAPIQGSAADLIKIAMIHIDKMMKDKKVKSKMILQVHDELIFDVPKDEVEMMKELVINGMVNALKLKVPLTVECSTGNNWYEAK